MPSASKSWHRRRAGHLLASAAVAVASLGAASPTAALPAGAAPVGEPALPPPSYPEVVELAQRELARNVRERKGDDVPRYRYGRGRIAPYSIEDAWCVAFATWAWNLSGFKEYLDAGIIWKSHGGQRVAVQVRDLTRWARQTGHFSTRAQPGFLVAYGTSHIGVVVEADRRDRAVISIEGNQSNGVSEVEIDMTRVTGYISPQALSEDELTRIRSLPADM